MKHMKAKLFVTLVMLLIAAVAMTSVSYAWFTVSTAPEIADIEVTMEATQNLEIAKAGTDLSDEPEEVTANDSASEENWGGKITSFTGTLQFPATLDSGAIKTVNYDATGRTNGLVPTTAPTAWTDGVGYYTADIKVGDEALLEDAKVAASFGIWLRSNVDTTATAAFDTDDADDDSKWGFMLLDDEGAVIENDAVTLTANEARAVQVVIFADGEEVVAEDIAEDLTFAGVSITFSTSDAAIDTFANQHAAA